MLHLAIIHLDLQLILKALNPLQPSDAIFAGVTLYIIMGMSLIALFMQPDGKTRDTIMISTVIFACIIDKVATTSIAELRNSIVGFTQYDFGTFLLRVLMFAFPLVVAGATKSEKSRPLLIFTGLLGGSYLFFRWFFEMRGV